MLLVIFLRLKTFFYQLNLFRNREVINNVHQIRNQYISTRIFLIVFPSIILLVLFYLLLTSSTTISQIDSPTDVLFKKLHRKYNESLQCPCSNLSIPYRTFLSLKAIYHPICSVDFELIINNLFNSTQSLLNQTNDYRFTGGLQLRLLTLLCSSVDEMIQAHSIDFNSTLFTNLYLLTQIDFEKQINEIINQFIQTITSQFINSLQMIRVYNFGSQV